MSTSYIFLADGFEEVEALTPVDMMRRAGLDIQTVSIGEDRYVTGAHGVTIEADLNIDDEDMSQADCLIAPGGMPGAKNLHDSAKVCKLFKDQAARGGKIAAICAAPAVLLAQLGILNGRSATCYPGFEKALTEGGAEYEADSRVVIDGDIITANGPSSALPFALAIVDMLAPGKAEEVEKQILL